MTGSIAVRTGQPSPSRTVALIGGAGFVGRATRQCLLSRGTSVLVVDAKASTAPDAARSSATPNTPPTSTNPAPADVHLALDIQSPQAEDALVAAFVAHGVTAVVHLAARLDPTTPQEAQGAHRLAVDGTRAVMHAAVRARVKHVVLISSATVYGAWPDNRVPLTEDAPCRPNPGYRYGALKLLQEQVTHDIWSACPRGQAPHLCVLRPAIVFGAGARNHLTTLFRHLPFLCAIDGRTPPLQFVHVEDVATAIAEVVALEVSGTFNVGHGHLAFFEVAQLAHKPLLRVPRALLVPGATVVARLAPPHWRAPPTMFPYLMHPFVVDGSRLTHATGFVPRVGQADCLKAALVD